MADSHKIKKSRGTGKRFAKGEGGRKKGAVNKTTKAVKDVFASVFTDLQDDPKAKLKVWAKANPTEFYKLAAKLIPIQVGNVEGEVFQVGYGKEE